MAPRGSALRSAGISMRLSTGRPLSFAASRTAASLGASYTQYVLVFAPFTYDFSHVTSSVELFAFTFFFAAASTPSRAPAGNVRSTRYRCVVGAGPVASATLADTRIVSAVDASSAAQNE